MKNCHSNDKILGGAKIVDSQFNSKICLMDLTCNNVVELLCVCTTWMHGEHMKQGLIE